ncbi:MAG: hypothetical protein GF355_16585, partial [Candidatus Eisenbacteria bacterium]|nr:hypothetical protein [Candidatus Eisenbacteria bacterium]
DLIKAAMVSIHSILQREKRRSRIILQIHDELLLEVPPGERDDLGGLVRREMEGAAELSVPLVVDQGWGRTWWDAHG